MSAAAFVTRPNPDSSLSSRAPHSAHPVPLRTHAFELHCRGLRSPAISEQLGVPQRTVRAWIAADLKALADEQRATRRQQLALAVERQHQLTATAWHEFEAETAARHALLDALLQVITHLSVPDHSATAINANSPRLPHLPASTPAPRYLSLVLQANKEINRLLGLYTLARLDLLTSDGPEAEPAPLTDSNIPAESATASLSPLLAGEGPGVGSPEFPAESATLPSGLAAGFGSPANRNAAILSPSLASASPAVSPPRAAVGPGMRFPLPAESATPSRNRPTAKRLANRPPRRRRH